MPHVTPARDETLAERGYLRVSLVARLMQMSVSAVSRWPKREGIDFYAAGGVCWMNWIATREFFNTHKNKEGVGLADMFGLPGTAPAALKKAKSLKA